MNRYKCDDCGWIYNAEEHQGVDLDDQDEGWVCERCQAERDHFHLLVPRDDDLAGKGEPEEKLIEQVDLAKGRVIFTVSKDPSVSTLKARYDRGRLDTRPGFQRYDVWTPQKKSLLIESMLLGLPIPILYLGQEPDESTIVVDGQQRLLAVFQFLAKDGYPLKGLGPLKETLQGKRFSELSAELQERIEEFQLSTVEILKESDTKVKFELFERLNRGSTGLNEQELRNCVFRGTYNEYIKDLATDATFRKLLKLKKEHKRMADVELVLRALAFYHQGFRNHDDKNTKEFLNRQMRLGESYSAKEREKAKADFKKASSLALTVFGDNAFKRFVPGDEEDPKGKWEPRNNRALLDVQLYGFTQHAKGVVVGDADAIRERAILLMCEPEFNDLITHTISEKRRVIRRFQMWLDALDEVIGDKDQGPRTVEKKRRQQLYEADPTCIICKQKIHLLDDAEVDHRVPYALGGETKDDNLVLTHRYCNRRKGALHPG